MASALADKGIDAARAARIRLGWGLDSPFADLLAVIEDTGEVPVSVLSLPEGLAGALLKRRGQSFIFINGDQAVVRERFTLAHEFGHHCLGHGEVIDRDAAMLDLLHDPQEVQANYFAAEFLAPERAVHNWVQAHGSPKIDLEQIVRLAVAFGISAKAARIRLETASFVGKDRAKRLDEEIDQGLHSKLQVWLGLSEVRDSLQLARESLPRLPARMRSNALASYEKGLVDVSRIAELLQDTPASIERQLRDLEISPPEPDPDY